MNEETAKKWEKIFELNNENVLNKGTIGDEVKRRIGPHYGIEFSSAGCNVIFRLYEAKILMETEIKNEEEYFVLMDIFKQLNRVDNPENLTWNRKDENDA